MDNAYFPNGLCNLVCKQLVSLCLLQTPDTLYAPWPRMKPLPTVSWALSLITLMGFHAPISVHAPHNLR